MKHKDLHISYRLLQAVVGVLCVLTVGLVIFGISYAAGTSGVVAVEADLRLSIMRSIENELTSFVKSAFDGVTVLAERLRLDAIRRSAAISSQSFESYRAFLFPIARQFAPTMYIGFPDGFFLGYSRLGPQAQANESYVLIESAFGRELQQDFYIDATGAPVEQYGSRFYNSTLRPWYQQAQTGLPIFTSVYAFTRVQALGITAVLPSFEDLEPSVFYDLAEPAFVTPSIRPIGERTLAAVCAADLTLAFLSDFLSGLDIGLTGEAFVLDLQGNFLGSSQLSRIGTEVVTQQLTHSTLVQDAIVNASMTGLVNHAVPPVNPNNRSDYQRLPETDGFQISVGGKVYSVSVSRYVRLDWYIVVLVPTADYLAGPQYTFIVSLIVGLCIIVVVAVILVVLSSLITRPMQRIQQDMESISRDLNFGDSEESFSRLNEIDSIQRSFSRMKKGLISFSRYVPMSVVRILMNNNSSAVLGVDSGEATSFFSDIEGFTSLSETTPPKVLIQALQEYFDRMGNIIDACNGTVGDYIGDAIFGFWNAPNPVERHTFKACRAALLQQLALDQLRAVWAERGMPLLRVRMGLSLGRVLMGNVGSSSRLKYTLLGDAVNLAARLESVNKIYNTQILICGKLRDSVISEFVCRLIDVVAVVGKNEFTSIYELTDWRLDDTADHVLSMERLSLEAMESYRNKNWADARAIYTEMLSLKPGDTTCEIFLDRIAVFEQYPPSADWNGRHILDIK